MYTTVAAFKFHTTVTIVTQELFILMRTNRYVYVLQVTTLGI
jgi:hypothetical protein